MVDIVMGNAADFEGVQQRVTNPVLLEATFDVSTFTITTTLYSPEWNAAKTAQEAGAPIAAKPAFYIWAEENGGIATNGYEWSFGNGATGTDIGVPMMVAANLTHISVNADIPGTTVTIAAYRQLAATGTGGGSLIATTSALNGTTDRIYTLPTPILFGVGDMLIVRTGVVVGTWTDVRACFRFQEV